MEKFSEFNDPFTGINPFVNLKIFKIKPINLFKTLFLLPIFLLIYLKINTITLFIKIRNKPKKIKGHIACNSSSIFDKYIIKHLFGNISQFYLTKTGFKNEKGTVSVLPKDAIIYVEGCNTNNQGLLRFVRNIKVDYVMGLKYSSGCIFMYGNFFKFLCLFLSNDNFCYVQIKESENISDLKEVCDMPQLDLGVEDKERFMNLIKK